MLYTFSQSDYPKTELDDYFLYITEKDSVVLWQDGVLLAVKYPDYLPNVRELHDIETRYFSKKSHRTFTSKQQNKINFNRRTCWNH